MAVVLDAVEGKAANPVAIKVLHRSLTPAAVVQQRFAREVAVARSLHHPAIVEFYEAFEEDGHQFLVMERMHGTLQEWVNQNGPVPLSVALCSMARVLEGLHHAHGSGVIHRDIKPQNLLLDADGRLKVSDFGIALSRDDGSDLTATGVLLGTLAFMAPEQKRNPRAVGPAADIYAIGAVLLWMLTGRLPFNAYVESRRASALAPFAPELSTIIDQACRFVPAQRFETAAEFAAALRAAEARLCATDSTEDRLQPRVLPEAPSLPLSTTTTWSTAADDTLPPETPEAPALAAPKLVRWAPWFLLATVSLTWLLTFSTTDQTKADNPSLATASKPASPKRLDGLLPCDGPPINFTITQRLGPRETLGLAAADLDANGQTDLVFVNQLSKTLSLVWDGQLEDTPTTQATIDELTVGRALGNPAVGDVNGDRISDLVVALPDQSELQVWLGSQDRSLRALNPQFQDGTPHNLHLLDWDSDGQLDLFMNHRDGVFIRRGTPNGVFAPPEGLFPDQNTSLVGVARDVSAERPPAIWVRTDHRLYIVESSADGTIHRRTELRDLNGPPLRLGVLRQPGTDSILVAWEPWRNGQIARFTTGSDTLDGCILGQQNGTDDHVVADVNQDGSPDLLGYRTCAGCESMHRLKVSF